MNNVATLATRHAGRPVLMLPRVAGEIAARLQAIDPRALERPTRMRALIHKLAGTSRPMAMEDDDGPPPVPFEERAAYAPLYAGQVEDYGFCWSLVDGVAMMNCDTALLDKHEDVCGTVYHGYDSLLQGLREAMADDRVKAIFLRLASPGGVVAGGLTELAAFMRANRAAAGGKPIHVFADMACSAAYWIAAQADKIIAPRVGLVGSIGAVLVHADYSGALEKAGVVIEAIQFGASKTDGAWWASLSDKARADLQAEIDQCGRDFVADVTAGRPQLTAEALIATQAAVYMAAHDEDARSGLALGFVDEIAGEEEAFRALAAQVSAPDVVNPPAAVGSRTATARKDSPMAVRSQANKGPKSVLQAKAAAARARADQARLEAEAAEAEAETAEEEGEEAKDPPPESAAPGDEPGDQTEKEDEEEAEAQAIASSAEAKSHPAMALAAIQSGQTLAQFQASVKAAGGARGQLGAVLGGSQRLGPDGAKSATAPAFASAGATFARNLEKGRSATRR